MGLAGTELDDPIISRTYEGLQLRLRANEGSIHAVHCTRAWQRPRFKRSSSRPDAKRGFIKTG